MSGHPVAIRSDEVMQLAPALEELAVQLREQLQQHAYGAIIVDASEHPLLPAAVQVLAEQWHSSSGSQAELPVFHVDFASEGGGKTQQTLAHARAAALEQGAEHRVLVLAAAVGNGESIAEAVPALRAAGLTFDVATLGGYFLHRNLDSFRVNIPQQQILAQLIEEAKNLQALSLKQASTILQYNRSSDRMKPVDQMVMMHQLRKHTVDDAYIDEWNDAIRSRAKSADLSQQSVTRFTNTVCLVYNVHSNPPEAVEELVQLLNTGCVEKDALDAVMHVLLNGDARLTSGASWLEYVRKHWVPEVSTPIDPTLDAAGWPQETQLFAGRMLEPKIDGILRTLHMGDGESQGSISAELLGDLRRIASWTAVRAACQRLETPELAGSMAALLDQLREHVRNDEYGFIVGDDTSGRVPALILAKAINAYRTEHGLRKLPVVFIEGTKRPHTQEQIDSFAARTRLLEHVPAGKRALIVTERVGGGQNVRSIMERINDLGYASDVATLGGAHNKQMAQFVERGYWRQGTRGFSADGNAELVLDRNDLSGLKPQKKFDPHPVIKGKGNRQALREVREDIQAVTPILSQHLE